MTTPTDRPTPRSRPRPAADEAHDPIVPSATATQRTATTPPPPNRRGAEPTVQLNVRVSADVNALIDEAATSTGNTKRQLIEHAIRTIYA